MSDEAELLRRCTSVISNMTAHMGAIGDKIMQVSVNLAETERVLARWEALWRTVHSEDQNLKNYIEHPVVSVGEDKENHANNKATTITSAITAKSKTTSTVTSNMKTLKASVGQNRRQSIYTSQPATKKRALERPLH
eukprot:GILJ01008358.1.p1 GENE.GILJ01008358.1~~GILJ01008358.1.p1  ORF type:complete len:137 (-),score=10.73 GILJ01008358.1:155-565(-)